MLGLAAQWPGYARTLDAVRLDDAVRRRTVPRDGMDTPTMSVVDGAQRGWYPRTAATTSPVEPWTPVKGGDRLVADLPSQPAA